MLGGLPIAFYLHDLDPFIFRITETIGPRWYGFAYVLAFFVGFLILKKLSEKGYCQLDPNQVDWFITLTALLGVMLGGRLGYMILYRPHEFFENPLSLFYITQGGMASHGGVAGVFFFTLAYARYHKISWTGIGDNLVGPAALGLFFGRIANFINGELYGHPTQVKWAVQFPAELANDNVLRQQALRETNLVNPEITNLETLLEYQHDPAVENILREILVPRHPSQIYQALLEGLLVFLIVMAIRLRWKFAPHGLITGIFFISYAICRIIGEVFRLPDAPKILGFSRGQVYSSVMILVGIAFVVFSLTKGKKGAEQQRKQAKA